MIDVIGLELHGWLVQSISNGHFFWNYFLIAPSSNAHCIAFAYWSLPFSKCLVSAESRFQLNIFFSLIDLLCMRLNTEKNANCKWIGEPWIAYDAACMFTYNKNLYDWIGALNAETAAVANGVAASVAAAASVQFYSDCYSYGMEEWSCQVNQFFCLIADAAKTRFMT